LAAPTAAAARVTQLPGAAAAAVQKPAAAAYIPLIGQALPVRRLLVLVAKWGGCRD